MIPSPDAPLSPQFRAAIGAALNEFFDAQEPVLAPLQPQLEQVTALARAFTAGGKRLRPACCTWGYAAAAPFPADTAPLLRAAASLDLLHVSALMHDDVMDDSATRRGLPAAHVQFAARHRDRGGDGDPAAFGRAGAILLGDLLLVWSAELYDRSGLDEAALARGRRYLHLVRTEVTGGQFLDIHAQTEPLHASTQQAIAAVERVVEYKTARYTMVRPLQLGAALAGGDANLIDGLGAFGSPLGRAFQYRDDVLGIFGDAEVTGKPAGDDLREGKRTVLLTYALDRLDDAGRDELEALCGQADLSAAGVERARDLIRASGALGDVEAAIGQLRGEALAALEATAMRSDARTALRRLVDAALDRTA